MDSVATDGETYSMWVVFFWSEMCTYASVGDISASIKRDVFFRDENDGACALDCTGNTLSESAKFLSICFPPDGGVFGVLDEVSVFHEFACVLIKNCIKEICREKPGCSMLSCEGWCVELGEMQQRFLGDGLHMTTGVVCW